MVAGSAYAMGGIGPGLFGLVLAGIGTVVGARFYIRHAIPAAARRRARPVPNERLWCYSGACGSS
jgi:hypothetical protein